MLVWGEGQKERERESNIKLLFLYQNFNHVFKFIINNDTILILIFIFKQVTKLYKEGDRNVNEQLFQLSRGPDKQVLSYKCYMVNGFKFHTNDYERC